MLSVVEMDAFYGKKQILFGIDIALPKRRIAAVIGPNGAGKSTVLRAIFGLGPQRQGMIRFNDKERSDVEEYCVSEGWIKVPAGKTLDRHGRPLLITLKGKVEAYYRTSQP